MGKLNAAQMRYITPEGFRVLAAVEKGMKNHKLVPGALAVQLANLHSGGTGKLLQGLCRQGVLSYERGKKDDGYRLTNMGYDYLALNTLTKRNTIHLFGHQIGEGKESKIYIVANEDGQELCLKLHRLGRICFRNITNKRDYYKNRNSASWLYLSRISATKEYTYMKALYDREFPVPKPIDFNRHCVIMELVQGATLCNVYEVKDAPELYNELMNLIVKLAECGVIHGDFNEFNIMLTENEKPIIIDFPQMVSTHHERAEMFFDRDVECVRKFFKKRFGYESYLFPIFSDVVRTDDMDAEIFCSGFTKKMARDLEEEFGMNDYGSSESAEIENEEDTDGDDSSDNDKVEKNDVNNEESSMSQNEIGATKAVESVDAEESEEEFFNANSHSDNEEDEQLDSSDFISNQCDVEFEFEDDSETFDNNSIATGNRFESASIRSTSTIIPDYLIKQRVKKEHVAQQRKECRKRCVAKGEASATTRHRRENRQTIKQSTGIWGWE